MPPELKGNTLTIVEPTATAEITDAPASPMQKANLIGSQLPDNMPLATLYNLGIIDPDAQNATKPGTELETAWQNIVHQGINPEERRLLNTTIGAVFRAIQSSDRNYPEKAEQITLGHARDFCKKTLEHAFKAPNLVKQKRASLFQQVFAELPTS